MEPTNSPKYPTVKELREKTGKTQQEIAQQLQISLRIVTDWEAGRKIPRLDNAARLAEALGVSLTDLAHAFNIESGKLSKP